ncbi:MAG: hypothetical protein KDL10_11415, partial [Kiritimatiellae bacterium]|nr:hypothetical protein [Kiritimatiellia bacterium]
MKFLQTLTIEVPRFRGGNAACGVIWSMLLGVAFLYAAGTGLKFPFWYHWDEESKAVQLTEGGRDLYHPLLLVNTADAVAHLVRPHQGSLQHATETGRMVAAAFMAASIAAMALAAWVTAGPMSGVLAGVFLFLHPLLFRYAHFFKEDPAL